MNSTMMKKMIDGSFSHVERLSIFGFEIDYNA